MGAMSTMCALCPLSERTGVQQAEISRIERGEVIPKITTMDKLLAPLGCHLDVVETRETTAA